MSFLTPNTILIIDPKKELAVPYTFLPQESKTTHLMSTQRATQHLQAEIPDLVIISTSYSPPQIFHLLEIIKEVSSSQKYLVPLIFSINLKHQLNFIPGTYWGEKLGVINSLSNKKEVELVLKRVCQE